MNFCPHCSGTGYLPQRFMSSVNKRLDRYKNSSKCLGPNDETNPVEADCNNNQIVHQNANEPACVCDRPKDVYECGRCYQFFQGRLAVICPQHKSDVYLMDFQCCPHCAAPNSMIKIAKFTSEQICKFESAELPGGDEGL